MPNLSQLPAVYKDVYNIAFQPVPALTCISQKDFDEIKIKVAKMQWTEA